jgi:hypothetical protein
MVVQRGLWFRELKYDLTENRIHRGHPVPAAAEKEQSLLESL